MNEQQELLDAAERKPAHEKLLAELKVRHLANVLIAASIFIVLGATLYPFDFTTDGFQQRLIPFLSPQWGNAPADEQDIVTNIILFLPIGFGFAILAKRKRMRNIRGLLIVATAGAALSLTVESLQLFLPFRYSSFIDVSSNALGSALGFGLYKLSAPFAYGFLTRAVRRGNKGHTTGWLATGYFLYLSWVLLISLPFQQSSLMGELNRGTFPLAVGNEPTGDRSWNGSIENLIVTRHELSHEGIADYFSGRTLNRSDSEMVMAQYIFKGKAPYKDLAKKHSALEWKGKFIDTTESAFARITHRRWLQTRDPANEMSGWIMFTRQFSICLTIASASQNEGGRIVTVSSDSRHRNFSLVQIGDDLGVRFISMTTGVNGANPQLIVPDLFADTLMHRIIVSLHFSHLHVYVDNVQRHYDVNLGPGFALLNRFFPSSGRLDISSRMRNFHNYLYDALVFMPLAYVLGLVVSQLRLHAFLLVLLACIGIAAPPFLLEGLLQHVVGTEFNGENLFVGLAIMFVTTVLTMIYHWLKPTPILTAALD